MTLHWSADLVGLPFAEAGRSRDGCDCWGLCCLAFASRGIALVSYAGRYVSTAEHALLASLISGDRAAEPWLPVECGDEREWDIAIFRRAGIDAHVGVVVAPGLMLHASAPEASRLERYDSGRWAPRLNGFIRHRDMP